MTRLPNAWKAKRTPAIRRRRPVHRHSRGCGGCNKTRSPDGVSPVRSLRGGQETSHALRGRIHHLLRQSTLSSDLSRALRGFRVASELPAAGGALRHSPVSQARSLHHLHREAARRVRLAVLARGRVRRATGGFARRTICRFRGLSSRPEFRRSETMAPRPTWRGYLRLSLVSCPVRVYPAISGRERISFHLLNPTTKNRVAMRPTDSVTGKELERADLIRGYEFEKGRYVVVDKDELDALKIESSETIDLERFVEARAIDPLYFDAPYYVVPEGKLGDETFRVIHQALRNKK